MIEVSLSGLGQISLKGILGVFCQMLEMSINDIDLFGKLLKKIKFLVLKCRYLIQNQL